MALYAEAKDLQSHRTSTDLELVNHITINSAFGTMMYLAHWALLVNNKF